MRPYYERDGIRVYRGDNREVVPQLDETFAAVVTDPPYGLSFMGRDWDHAVPGVAFWQTFREALAPGGHLLAFGGTRLWHRLAVAIEDAGFDIKDTIMWLYGQGFPKHKSLLKPAWEPIILARKPGGTGALNIDACRIPADAADPNTRPNKALHNRDDSHGYGGYAAYNAPNPHESGGRWPANVVLDEAAAAALDQMSGERHGAGNRDGNGRRTTTEGQYRGNAYGTFTHKSGSPNYADTGGASRFFYCAKSSRRERTANGTVANGHPTCKPTSLMKWLLTLVTPPGGIVLDPFAGSGTTGVAAAQLGIPCVLIEQEAEYLPIIAGRIDHALNERAGAELPLFAGVAD